MARARFASATVLTPAILAMAALSGVAQGWDGAINGFGNGFVTVKVWCSPNRPPAAPDYEDTAFGDNPTASLGPNLPGCDPQTKVRLSGEPGIFNRYSGNATSAGGDWVDGHELVPLVTPTAPFAFISLDVVTVPTSATSADYMVSWFGSDMGTAQMLRWRTPGGDLLREELRVGPFSEMFTASIDTPGLAWEGVILETQGIASSIPTPGAAALLSLGGLLAARRRR
ncbi:MAG: hypothetical protein ACKVS8_09270 [Phycisphaerales bacterium]